MNHDENKHAFFCPACHFGHWFKTGAKQWTWNGDRDKPTINPSVLAYDNHFRCHSYVRNGQIQFLGDCTHELRNQTVDLPEFP